MILSLLLFAAGADPAAPRPGPIKTFGDWAVACDNVHACEMTSLIPTQEMVDGTDSGGYFSIARAAGPDSGFVVEISSNGHHDEETAIRIDGKAIASGTITKDSLSLTGARATAIVAALANGKRLSLTNAAGTEFAHASLAGSSAALRFIDADQGRAGGVTAAVAKGGKPANAVPAALPLPRVRSLPASGKAAAITPTLLKQMVDLSGCDTEDSQVSDPIKGDALAEGKTLVLMPCGSGAYNFSTVAVIVSGGKPGLARFDFQPGGVEAMGTSTLINAAWDAKTARLQSYAKQRGIGDCGASEDYAWDGSMFRLVEARRMDECQGSSNWLAVWRATPVRP
ncbi:DUF1176 domain-containing protein [Sphingomonas alpina]|uniref:DUF1176 domain-containing protein n=1 Tax=Sphingomonas alpina TaxID=653931 RepID=A0A7H0LGY6_9SPHN|nr:DUF1176 domain-containing protein [Sphingomonas alpina]QNQ08939.1 DUF1176 domain-containing protein [Sphingomonas alpina]